MHQGDNDSGARVANGVAEGNGTTIDVDFLGIETQDLLSGSDNNGEGFVDLE